MDRLIDEIRKEYPCPITMDEAYSRYGGFYDKSGELVAYCVVIATFQWWSSHRSDTYPLSHCEERKIVEANDKGNFQLAWALLGNVLEARDKKLTSIQ